MVSGQFWFVHENTCVQRDCLTLAYLPVYAYFFFSFHSCFCSIVSINNFRGPLTQHKHILRQRDGNYNNENLSNEWNLNEKKEKLSNKLSPIIVCMVGVRVCVCLHHWNGQFNSYVFERKYEDSQKGESERKERR